MNIAVLVDSLAIGGAERQAILCVAELRKLGHSVDLVYYRPRQEYSGMLRQLEIDPVFIPAKHFVSRCHQLSALFKRRGYDVVHGFKMAAEVYAAVAGAWAGVPRRFGNFRSIYNLGPKYRLLHFAVDKLLDGWVVNSQAAAESMSRRAWIAKDRIHVLRNGVCLEALRSNLSMTAAKQKLGLSAETLVITMVGRLEEQKNYPMLLQVAKQVSSKAQKAHFLVVGKGSQDRALHQQRSDLALDAGVSFLGLRSDIGDLLAATDISVLTSNYEGLPNVIIEAMGAGKPIVCTEYPGAREIMSDGDNALLSPCGNIEMFSRKVLMLIGDPTLRQKLATAATSSAEREFSAGSMARRLENIYLRQNKDPQFAREGAGTSSARVSEAGNR